jgi:TPR repeat protein
MSFSFNDDLVEDCVWSVISPSMNSGDFLTFLAHFSGSSRYRNEAIDKAVSVFTPGMNTVQSCYYEVPDALRKLGQSSIDQQSVANIWFHLGKMFHNGYGTVQDHVASIEAYKKAIALGELRSLVNLASHYVSGTGTPVDTEKARDLFQQAADLKISLGYLRLADMLERDDVDSQIEFDLKAAELNCPIGLYRIAMHYIRGSEKLVRDHEQSIAWMIRAARAGHEYACYHLGWNYEHGRHVIKDVTTAAEWYRLGAQRLDSASLRALGILHFYAVGVEENYEDAIKLFSKAAVLGDPPAQRRLGHELIWGALNGGENDSAQAKGIAWLKLAEAQGDERSAELLAKAYRRGLGVETDLAKSSEYLLKAAKAGIAEAQGQMGLNYWFASGVEENHAEAYKWLNMCALQGEGRGLYLLGKATEGGIGCKKDHKEAFRLYQLAAEKEEVDAVYQLAECFYYGTGVEKDPQQAIIHYKQAARMGSNRAKTDLGWFLYQGEYVETNYDEAAKWFIEAANQDEPRAMYFLALLHQNGDGVEESEEVCRRWMGRAAMLDYKPAKEWIEKHLPKAPDWLEQLVNPNE